MKATSYKYLKIIHIYRLYRDQSANTIQVLFSGTKLQHPFLHPKLKAADNLEILRFRNLLAELLDWLRMPQTKPLLHGLMLSFLIIRYNLQCLSFFSLEE